ncbi:MAG: C69 family dipeptidase, partial [Bacteroidota bacterium]
MRKIFLLVFIWLQGAFLFSQTLPTNGFNCYTIIAGKDATANGVVTLAHNEDDHGENIVNLLKVPEFDFAHTSTKGNISKQIHRTKNGADIKPVKKKTHGFLWLEMPGQDFAGCYINDKGVVIVSNACPSREDKPELSEGGIGFMFRRILAESAGSAREAVEIAAGLIEKYGYDSSGRTYSIADKDEAWVLAVVNGKHWVAQRVPDDEVMIIPNYFTITKINPGDKENFMVCHDIIEYATKRGWYDAEKDGDFNFRKAYGSPESLAHPGNIARKWQGLKFITGKNYPMDEALPFSVKPARKLKTHDFMQMLGNHYEGTEFDASRKYRNGNPHKNPVNTICAVHNQYGFVAGLKKDIPENLGVLIWLAFRRPCIQPFLPVYSGIEKFPSSYHQHTPEVALKNHLSPPETLKMNSNHAFQDYIKFADYADKHYAAMYDKTHEYKNNLQKKLFE